MSYRTRFIVKTVFLLTAALFLVLSCSDDAEGIFYSLEIEEKAADNSLPNEVRITGDIIKMPSATTPVTVDRYYIATGSVFYRTAIVPPPAWTKIKSPISGGIVTGIALIDATDEIFVSVTNGSSHGLYRLDPAADYSTYDTAGGNLYSAKQITRLMSLNGNLFAAVGLPGSHELLYFNGTTLVPTGLTGYKILAGAWDGAAYWFLGAANLFTAAGVPGGWSSTPVVPAGGLVGKTYFKDIFSDAPGTLYICTSDGYIVKSTDSGAIWVSSGDHNQGFLSISKVAGIIVLGESGDGVFEMTNANDVLSGIKLPGGNYGRLPDLNNSTVLRLFGDGVQLIAGTSSAGVWRGDYSSSTVSPNWSQE